MSIKSELSAKIAETVKKEVLKYIKWEDKFEFIVNKIVYKISTEKYPYYEVNWKVSVCPFYQLIDSKARGTAEVVIVGESNSVKLLEITFGDTR